MLPFVFAAAVGPTTTRSPRLVLVAVLLLWGVAGRSPAVPVVGLPDFDPRVPAAVDVPLHDCMLLFRFGEDPSVMTALRGSEARSINDVGQVAGWFAIPTGAIRAARWTAEGVAQDLGTLGGRHSCALDVNNAGHVVGWAQTATGVPHAFRWVDGVMHDLGADTGEQTVANAISDSGLIVGLAWPIVPRLGRPFGRAVVWDGEQIVDLHTALGQPHSGAQDVNGSSAVVGWMVTVDGPTHAFLWDNGKLTDLGSLAPASCQARAVNDLGQVVGWAELASGTRHAVRWERDMMVELAPERRQSVANGLDETGNAVGAVIIGEGWLHPVRFADGEVQDLGTLGGWHGEAYAINQGGQVVGWAQSSDGIAQAFRWTRGEMSALPGLLTRSSIGVGLVAERG